jgi:DNA-binding beta-propeller fold protein YncE
MNCIWLGAKGKEEEGAKMREEKLRGISSVFGITAGLIVIFNAFIIAEASSNQYLYWTDSKAGTVHRSNLDGSNDVVLVTGLRRPRDVEVDVSSSKIYWTDFDGGKIQRCNLDGAGKQTIYTTIHMPNKIELDLKNGMMYWTENTGGFGDMIKRTNLDGSSVQTLYSYPSPGGPTGIALNVDGGKMYLGSVSAYNDIIVRRNLLGGAAVTLTQAGRAPTDIVLDISNGKMYWGEYDDMLSFNGKIKWANLDGSGVQTTVTGLQWPMGLDLDFINSRVYWTDMVTHKIQYSTLDGSGITDILSNSLYEPHGITIIPEPATLLFLGLGALRNLKRFPRL